MANDFVQETLEPKRF